MDGNKVTINGYGNIGLVGISKGYATAKAKEYLESEGISSYYIDAGHSSIALGSKNGDYLNVGLSKPYSNGYICKIKEKNLVISCSSPQNQYIKIDNNYYHHLLNPFTGYPSNTFDSVFVLNNNPMEGDYYSTALFNMSYSDCVNYSK
jgi:thiamine biosynthesis lipoprotein